MKKKKGSLNGDDEDTSPVRVLERELAALRRDLRSTVRAYTARLEIDLAKTTAAVLTDAPIDKLSRERLHQIRDLTILVRNRKVKPAKGRRKDLRQLDEIIGDLHAAIHPCA